MRTKNFLYSVIPMLGAILAWLPATAAMATLGESAQSVNVDQHVFGGQVTTMTRQELLAGRALSQPSAPSSDSAYTVEQILTPNGTTVNEYILTNGTVFAVSWRGQTPPDLSQLLGSYFVEYQAAAAALPRPRGPHRIRTENVVVDTGGHMRDLWGRAYIPALLPTGVSLDEIQ